MHGSQQLFAEARVSPGCPASHLGKPKLNSPNPTHELLRPASAFRHQNQSGTAGHRLDQHYFGKPVKKYEIQVKLSIDFMPDLFFHKVPESHDILVIQQLAAFIRI
jgi:hypothetical protein